MSDNNVLKILFVEDMDADYELAENELLSNGINFISKRVENSLEFTKELNEFIPDIVISDYSLPRFNGMQALKISKDYDRSLPFIILTGTMNEEIAVECMKAGATDYVIKEHMGKLSFAVKEALSYRDIILKKAEAEAALLESESRYRSMFENNYAVMMLIDPVDGRIIDVNPAASEFYGFSRQDLAGKMLYEISSTETLTLNDRLTMAMSGEKKHFIAKHILHNREERDVEIFSSPISYSSKNFIFCIIQDITDRNKALEDLKKSLIEKRELIREIYHRTKNNMQVIISMFSLQSIFSGDEKLDSILKDMENRIRAMSLVHEKLYQSKNMSKLDLKDYLSELVYNIISGYGITDDKILISEKMENMEVLIDTAIPCGLVINELVTNVARYAFPDDNKGELQISLKEDKNGEIELMVADNGIGRDMKINLDTDRTMGIQIVKNIVEYQLKGKIYFDGTAGIKWTIRFKDNMYEARI